MLMPAILTFERVATPLPSVVAEPTPFPLSEKLMILPGTPLPPDVSVADRFTVPPKKPVAGATARLVGSEFSGPNGNGQAKAPRLRVQRDNVVPPRSICISQIITFGRPALNRVHTGVTAVMSSV